MKKTADAILTGDIHLRRTAPVCRLDDFWETQQRKMNWLHQLQQKHQCPILDSGDLLDKWRSSLFLLWWAMGHLPHDMISVPGNHDLPQHNLSLLHNSGIALLEAAGKIKLLHGGLKRVVTSVNTRYVVRGFEWGTIPGKCPEKSSIGRKQVALCHVLTYKKKKPFPGCEADAARVLLHKSMGYDLIVTGDNHQTFDIESKGRRLVNPGSFMRTSAAQADHKPTVFLWYADTNEIEPVRVPVEKDVISRDHIDIVDQRNDRIDSFIEKLNLDMEVSLSFQNNLEEFFRSNKVSKTVEEIVWEVVE